MDVKRFMNSLTIPLKRRFNLALSRFDLTIWMANEYRYIWMISAGDERYEQTV